MSIDVSSLIKDVKTVSKNFIPKDEGELVVKETLLLFPVRFVEIGLAKLKRTVEIPRIYMVIVDNKYAVSTIPVSMEVSPNKIEIEDIDGVEYYVLTFLPNSIFTANRKSVKSSGLIYDLYNEFLVKGKIPFFIDYDSISSIFLNILKYGGSDIGKDHVIIDTLVSIVARDSKDLKAYYRTTSMKEPFTPIGLDNIISGYHNNTARLTGSYLQLGIGAAINDQVEEATPIEKVLRA